MNVVRLCLAVMVAAVLAWLSTETATADTSDEATPAEQPSISQVHTVVTFAGAHGLAEVEAALEQVGRPVFQLHHAGPTRRGIRAAGGMSATQIFSAYTTDRLDPERVTMIVDEPDDHFDRRSSSAWAIRRRLDSNPTEL